MGAPSIEDLYDRYAHLVYRRCFLLLGNRADAEDATQEVYVRALKALPGFRGESSPMTWLYRISTNHCLNQLRARKHRRSTSLELDELPAALQVSPELAERAALLRQILPRFDRRSQQLAVGFFVDGMSQEELADQMGLSTPTVRKYLKKFLDRSRRLAGRAR